MAGSSSESPTWLTKSGPSRELLRVAMTFMPSACARRATSVPMPPSPATSKVLPPSACGWEPAKLRLQPSPVAWRPMETCSERDSANISPMVCSAITGPATARMLVTMRPGRSTPFLPRQDSTPAEYTAAQRNFFAAASTRSSQTASSPPAMASASFAFAMNSSMPDANTTSRPGAADCSDSRSFWLAPPSGFCDIISSTFGGFHPGRSRSAAGLSASPSSCTSSTALGSGATAAAAAAATPTNNRAAIRATFFMQLTSVPDRHLATKRTLRAYAAVLMSKAQRRGSLRLIGTLLAVFSATHAYPQNGSARSAAPLDPVDGIIAAFKTHAVVALGEGDHNNEQGHAVRLKLIRDARFAKLANDIVVEFGNSRYQDIMDRYVRGEDVPYASLQPDLAEHDPGARGLGRSHLRGVLPHSPRRECQVAEITPASGAAGRHADRLGPGAHPGRVAQGGAKRHHRCRHHRTRGTRKGRRALIVYGDMHLVRRNTYWMMEDQAAAEARFAKPVDTIVALLEKSGARVFSIRTLVHGHDVPAAGR